MDSPSTSDSSCSNSDHNCKVCSKKGHGLHYGVITCRSCAAFFRRTFVINKKYKCIEKNGQCGFGLKKNGCRFCRFKKCVNVGMVTENVHLDDVSVGSPDLTIDLVKPTQIVNHRVEYKVVDWITQKTSTLVDVNVIIAESRAVLEDDYFQNDCPISYNLLETMTHALNKIREKQEHGENLEVVENIKFNEVFKIWHSKMRDASEWLMHSEEFRKLPKHERVEIFKNVWGIWRRFERYTMSAQMFGPQAYNDRIYVHSNKHASYLAQLTIDQSLVINPNYTTILSYFLNDWFELVVRPCVEYKFTPTEVTYMLCQITWSYASRRLQGQTLEASERFLEEIGNNLHQYYRNMCPIIRNYSERIVKMMKIVNDVLDIQRRREKVMDVAFLFDYFDVTFTDPDFFRV